MAKKKTSANGGGGSYGGGKGGGKFGNDFAQGTGGPKGKMYYESVDGVGPNASGAGGESGAPKIEQKTTVK